MKSKTLPWIIGMTLCAALTMPVLLPAQEQQQQPLRKEHLRYKLVDIGTFGGPTSLIPELQQILSSRGSLVGQADTSTPDSFPAACFNADCFVSHTFQWQNGVLSDLGALPGVNSSIPATINARGLVAGISQNGVLDPLTGAPEVRAVLWKDGRILDLGTLGGNESGGFGMNDRGQVIGTASNTIPDPFSFLGATQARAFLWQNGTMKDLGTLGGPDSFGQYVNDRGQVAGFSYTSYNPGPLGIPPVDPFLWTKGTLLDLGSLGGTFGAVNSLNNRGQVVGASNLSGDIFTHGFLWDRGVLTDVGTFGGDNGEARWLNEAGEIAGSADFPGDQVQHAFLWKKGALSDLGTVDGDPCSSGYGINSSGQIVGASSDCFTNLHAFLWENGGPMMDLNTLIPPNSGLQLTVADFISDRGEIAGVGVPSGCSPQDVDFCGHAFLLIPCEEGDKGDKECEEGGEGATAETQNQAAPRTQTPRNVNHGSITPETLAALRARMARRYHIPGLGAPRN